MWLLQKVSGPAARPRSVSGLQVDAGGVFSLAGWLLFVPAGFCWVLVICVPLLSI